MVLKATFAALPRFDPNATYSAQKRNLGARMNRLIQDNVAFEKLIPPLEQKINFIKSFLNLDPQEPSIPPMDSSFETTVPAVQESLAQTEQNANHIILEEPIIDKVNIIPEQRFSPLPIEIVDRPDLTREEIIKLLDRQKQEFEQTGTIQTQSFEQDKTQRSDLIGIVLIGGLLGAF